MISARGKINNFINLAKTRTAKQTGALYAAQILAMALGFITVSIVTRTLGPEKYGILAFILAAITFISLFFEFGFFSAGARLLAISRSKRRDQELIGALTLITVGISLSFFLVLFIFSFFIDSIFRTSAGNILRSISMLAAIVPFQYMLRQVCKGTNKIKKMAIANVTPRLWYLAGLLVVVCFLKLDVFLALILNLTGIIVAIILIIQSLKPKFNNLKENLKIISKETREYGFHVYCGRVVDLSTYQLDKIFISYFLNTLWVGFYNLAMVITSPMALFSRALSTSLFKGFAKRDEIPQKVILFNFLWLASCAIGLTLLGKYIVVILFSDKYLPAVPLILPLVLAGFFQGMYQPYNMFVASHRKGKWMRDVAFIMAGVNFIGNISLIPLFGAIGAGYASAFSMGFSLIVHFYNYRRALKSETI